MYVDCSQHMFWFVWWCIWWWIRCYFFFARDFWVSSWRWNMFQGNVQFVKYETWKFATLIRSGMWIYLCWLEWTRWLDSASSKNQGSRLVLSDPSQIADTDFTHCSSSTRTSRSGNWGRRSSGSSRRNFIFAEILVWFCTGKYLPNSPCCSLC